MANVGRNCIFGAGSVVTRTVQSPRTRHARGLFAGLPSHYDRLATLLSLGQDPRWRRFMVSRVRVPAGARVLDVATGRRPWRWPWPPGPAPPSSGSIRASRCFEPTWPG